MRNRAALVAAAEEVFSERGVNAPLADVAGAAGVGRATLSRHFPDRFVLAAAVYDQHLDDVETFVAERGDAGCVLDTLVRRIVDGQRRLTGLFPLMRSTPCATSHLAALGDRLARILEEPLAAAQRRGEIDPGVTVDDLQIVLTMAEGVLASFDGDEQVAHLDRALTIALAGLRPGGGVVAR